MPSCHVTSLAIPLLMSTLPLNAFNDNIIGVPRGGWASPGGTAIPGQPVGWGKQASHSTPHHKNWDNSIRPLGPNISY